VGRQSVLFNRHPDKSTLPPVDRFDITKYRGFLEPPCTNAACPVCSSVFSPKWYISVLCLRTLVVLDICCQWSYCNIYCIVASFKITKYIGVFFGATVYKRCLSCMQLLAFLVVQGVLYLENTLSPTVRGVIGQLTVYILVRCRIVQQVALCCRKEAARCFMSVSS